MGENGAGKSTLIKALTGVYKIDCGSDPRRRRARARFSGTGDAQSAGISTVYQEVNLCDNLTIGENVMLGHEVRGRLRHQLEGAPTRPRTRRPRRARPRPPRPAPAALDASRSRCSSSSRSAAPWSTKSKVLILDEPTSSLDANEVEGLFAVMRRLRDQGVAILFVSHFLDQVYAISDRLTVLRNGEFVGEYLTRDLDRSQLISKMIGKDFERARAPSAPSARTASTAASSRFYRADGPRPEGLDRARRHRRPPRRGRRPRRPPRLRPHRARPPDLRRRPARHGRGHACDGKNVEVAQPTAGLAHKIAFSTREPPRRGHHRRPHRAREPHPRRPGPARLGPPALQAASRTRSSTKYLVELNVRPADPERPIKNLSGGNQQKVLLGRWLATQPELLILDEPTRGIDVGAKAEIQEAIAALADDGVAVVFISSELEEVVRLSDRIVVLKDHRKIGEIVNGPDVTAETIVDYHRRRGSRRRGRRRARTAPRRRPHHEQRHPTTGELAPHASLIRRQYIWGAVAIVLLLLDQPHQGPRLPRHLGQPHHRQPRRQPHRHPPRRGADHDDRRRHDAW